MLYKQILTNDQIDELNNLLIDHSETISAFYDEGITYGLRKGCLIGFIGCSLGVLSGIIIDEIVKYKKITEIRDRVLIMDSFFYFPSRK